MKIHTSQFHLRAAGCGILFCLAAAPLMAVDATPHPAGPLKVRVMVKENNVASAVGGGTGATTPAAAGAAKAPAGKPAPAAAAQAPSELDAEKYTRTTKKSLTVDLVNLTGASMDVNVKTTFLAKDEAPGKHDVIPEKTVENKLTLDPTRAGEFTTEEVPFTHTTAHRQVMQKPGGAGGKGAASGKGAIAPMIPTSGHAYFGYKVEVFQGNDLVGSAVSDNH